MRDPHSRLPFKYAPRTFNELILNPNIKEGLFKALTEFPTMFLLGPKGIGKGSYTEIFLKETGCDYIWINGSDENGIDIVRNKITTFATALGDSDIKVIVINEIDKFTPEAQNGLLEKIERVQQITRFIFIGNHNVLIPPLLSRCQIFEFSEPPAKEIYERCVWILEQEEIKYKKNSIIEIIKKNYPDIRHILNVIDQNIVNGHLSEDLLLFDQNKTYDEIVNIILTGNSDIMLKDIRKILRSKSIDYEDLYKRIYERIDEFDDIAKTLIYLGEAARNNSYIALKEINFMAFVSEIV